MKNCPGIIARLYHTDRTQLGLLKEQYAEWKKARLKYCCNQVWMKMVGRYHGMLHPSAKNLRTFVWWEDSTRKTKPTDWSTFLSPSGFPDPSNRTDDDDWLTDWHAFWFTLICLSLVCLCEQLAECHVIQVLVRWRDSVGEGTWRVVELAESHEVGLITCEGDGNVVGVVTPLIRGVTQEISMTIRLSSSEYSSQCRRWKEKKKTG